MIDITDKQAEVLRFIHSHIQQRGVPPTIRELGKQTKATSLRGATVHLDALERKGYIKRGAGCREIVLLPLSARVCGPSLLDEAIDALQAAQNYTECFWKPEVDYVLTSRLATIAAEKREAVLARAKGEEK